MELTILCFDRDLTVDVNFEQHNAHMMDAPVDAEPVPLAWVKHYAHAVEGVDVWATGNQRLRKEGAIPGLKEARLLWESLHETDITSHYKDTGILEHYKPTRRDGLRIIQSIYEGYSSDEDSLRFVVVDDVDLSDMAHEWGEHYYAWDFVKMDEWLVKNPEFSGVPVNSPECSEALVRKHTGLDELCR